MDCPQGSSSTSLNFSFFVGSSQVGFFLLNYFFGVCYRCYEVLVNGRKQGVTKKTMDQLSGASALCKKLLLDAFKRLRRDDCDAAADTTYAQIKREATSYRHRWTAVKSQLGCWTDKPESLLEFT